jgi:hypothetical protein
MANVYEIIYELTEETENRENARFEYVVAEDFGAAYQHAVANIVVDNELLAIFAIKTQTSVKVI